MHILYSLILFLSLLLLFPCYFFRRTIIQKEGLAIKQRLGFGLRRIEGQKDSVWIHAVSVGEVLSLQRLIKQLRVRHPSWLIRFSSLTPAGMRMAREKLEGVDVFFFIPLDFRRVVRKFFSAFNPRVLVLVESELWPNLLKEAKRKGVSTLLVNGRMSDRSFQRYRLFKCVARKIFQDVELFLVQTEQDRKRFEEVGVDPQKIYIAGNLKAEVELPNFTAGEVAQLRETLNIREGKKVIVAGSTREGEEKEVFRAFSEAKKVRGDLCLIIAPRHLDRVGEVERDCRSFSLRVQRRTAPNFHEEWDVLILDTMGELARFYALADVAFVGGSLVRWGGHNLLEPAFYGKPVVFGPHMNNFAFFAETFVRHGAARVVKGREDFVAVFLGAGGKEFEEMGIRAKATLGSLQGATERIIEAVETYMGR